MMDKSGCLGTYHGKSVTAEDEHRFMVKLVKAAAQEVIDRAEDLVGSCDYLTALDIWLRFPPNECPQIEVSKEHVARRCFNVMIER